MYSDRRYGQIIHGCLHHHSRAAWLRQDNGLKKLAAILNADYINIDRVLDEHELTEDKEDGYIS